LLKLLAYEKNLKPYHYKNLNFMGPGTPVATHIVNGIKPKSYQDHNSRQHDLDYYRANGDRLKTFFADVKAIIRSYDYFDDEAVVLRSGLLGRSILDFYSGGYINFNSVNDSLSQLEIDEAVDELEDIIKSE
jgi:hypothetical protein